MRFVFLILALLGLSPVGQCQVPTPALYAQRKVPADLEGLYWNKWDTKNFVVISLNKSRGSSMRRELEVVRDDVLKRWSLPEVSRGRCKVVVVPSSKLLKRLFGLSEPKCEVSKSGEDGLESAIWVDEERLLELSSLVVERELLCGDFRPFLKRGIPLLEGVPSQTRTELSSSSEMKISSFLNVGPDSEDAEVLKNSALLCLLVRKEFGSRVFGKLLSNSSAPLHDLLGFASESDLGSTYARYRANLLADLKSGRTPDEYLSAPR